MDKESAVTFSGDRRFHMGLGVQDLSKSIGFYTVLFGQGPTKIREDYAKYEMDNPSVNFSLYRVGTASARRNRPEFHFGIQVKSTQEVSAATRRLWGAQLEIAVEKETSCCYAVQNKVCVTDPDGHKWEVFVVLDAEPEKKPDNTTFMCCGGNSGRTHCAPKSYHPSNVQTVG